MSTIAAPVKLTENEGCVLSHIRRYQPVTAYHIVKLFKESPVASFNSSVGHVYPMFKRFAKANLIEGCKVENDSRGTEQWSITDTGSAILKQWLFEVRTDALLAHDSLRTKILSFGMLTHQERIDWVILSKAKLDEQLREMTEWQKTVDVPFAKWAHDNASSTIKARMEWLDRVLFDLVTEGPDAPAA